MCMKLRLLYYGTMTIAKEAVSPMCNDEGVTFDIGEVQTAFTSV